MEAGDVKVPPADSSCADGAEQHFYRLNFYVCKLCFHGAAVSSEVFFPFFLSFFFLNPSLICRMECLER